MKKYEIYAKLENVNISILFKTCLPQLLVHRYSFWSVCERLNLL